MAPTSDPTKYTGKTGNRTLAADSVDGMMNLSFHYGALADDGASSGKKREAAVMLAVAEDHLEQSGDFEEALRTGILALDAFREINDGPGVADAVRMVVQAHVAKAAAEARKPDEALKLAGEELSKFKKAGDKVGEAYMWLTLAKVKVDMGGGRKLAEAFRDARQAVSLSGRVGDKKMEAQVMITLAEINVRKRSSADALREAENALELLQSMGDKRGQAKAFHIIGSAHAIVKSFDRAVRSCQDALAIYKGTGDKMREAMELRDIARFLVEAGKSNEAIKTIKEAESMAQALKNGRDLHMDTIRVSADAYKADKDPDMAVRQVRKAMKAFKDAGAADSEAEVMGILARTLLSVGELEEAQKVAERAVTACRESGSRKLEVAALQTQGEVQLERKEYGDVISIVREATPIYKSLGDFAGMGQMQHLIVDVNCKREKWPEAMIAAKEARDLFAKGGDNHAEARALLVISIIHYVMGEDTDAVSSAKQAQFLFKAENDNEWEARAWHEVAELYAWDWNPRQAVRASERCAALKKELNDKKDLAVALSTLGVARLMVLLEDSFTDVGVKETPAKSEEVLRVISDATAASQDAGDEMLIIFNHYHTAEVHMLNFRTPEAMQAIEEAESLNKTLMDKHAQVVGKILTAYAYLLQDQDGRAAQLVDEASELAENNEDVFWSDYGNFLANKLKETINNRGGGGGGGGGDSIEGGAAEEVIDPEILKLKINDVANSLMGIESLAGDTPLMDAGLDSLSMVEFRNELVKEFPGVDLPGALLFDYPTVNALADFVAEGIKAGSKSLKN